MNSILPVTQVIKVREELKKKRGRKMSVYEE